MDGERKPLEHLARSMGKRWARRVKAQYSANGEVPGQWPGALDQARRLVDELVGTRLTEDEREPLAIIVERSARRAWH